MQYAIEISNSCNFQVSQHSVETSLGKVENLYDTCVLNFLRNLSERSM